MNMRIDRWRVRLLGLLLLSLVLAGCDKCGERVKFNSPFVPASCGANAAPDK